MGYQTFYRRNDIVLDPFMELRTALIVANRMRKNLIGIDLVPEYSEMVKQQFRNALEITHAFGRYLWRVDCVSEIVT